jgi:hypothetical protein
VEWLAKSEEAVENGAIIVRVGSRRLHALAAGILVQKAPEGALVSKSQLLAAIVEPSLMGQATVTGKAATLSWGCELVAKTSGQRAPCKLVKVVPRGDGSYVVTLQAQALWIDEGPDVQLQLTPP